MNMSTLTGGPLRPPGVTASRSGVADPPTGPTIGLPRASKTDSVPVVESRTI